MPSSVIRAFNYLPDVARLEIEFLSGRRYVYLGVPADKAAALQKARSKGRFFNRHIRDHFPFLRIR
ncbi:KTSC domain-containing protein [Flavisphingomonas formosensis]|uniref:KTSC domain-containing protein n=1 Tax=Flavisphingomonas formosensis TaxID=861534 RepID=UPI0012F7981C|nr:KTSC domain-containing protein [Sphingomonas formosensis]